MTALPTARPAGRRRPLRLGPLSTTASPRTAALVSAAGAGLVALAVWAVTLGDFPLSAAEVGQAVAGEAGGHHEFVVRTLRLPRTLVAVLAGGALGVSGALFQGLVRNPLVAPDVIGVMAGAALAAVVSLVVVGSAAMVPVAAVLGALTATVAVYGLAWRHGLRAGRLVLVGVAVSFGLWALTWLVIVRYPVEQISPAIVWITGTVYGADWGDVAWLTGAGAVLIPLALALLPRLRALQLGDDLATALGTRTEPARAALLATGAALAAAAVAVVGPLAFVALATPHLARMLAGPLTGGVLVLAGLLGAALVLAADVVAQHALATSLPAGVVTGAIGAPFFLLLLVRTHRAT